MDISPTRAYPISGTLQGLNVTCKRVLLALLLAVTLAISASAQTVAPFMGLGNAQFFDNNGKPLTAGMLYSYQAGTSTQQATFTDSTGTTLNPNPIPFGSGARVQIWLTAGAFYKFVLCLQNDGPFCAPADVLFSVDQVPGSPGAIGSSGTFTGTFISGSANPATTGILRLASSDAICWRNAAGTANLCIRKDASDVLSWDGGAMKFPEIPCANAGLGFDYLCASSANHRWMMANNGGGQTQIVGAGPSINTSDQVVNLFFGTTSVPLSATPPSISGQYFKWNGTQMVAGGPVLTNDQVGIGVAGADPTPTPLCSGVLTYSTATHLFTCSVAAQALAAIHFTTCALNTNNGSQWWCDGTQAWGVTLPDTNYKIECTITAAPNAGGFVEPNGYGSTINAGDTKTTTTFSYHIEGRGSGSNGAGYRGDCIAVE